jgi:O-acetyl-ADP-ribose deacetylase
MKIEIIKGDITQLNVEVIINAANNALMGGGGVDWAIHNAAGKDLMEECRLLKGCEPGQLKITKGYNLPAKYIIHAVGPVWNNGTENEEALLKSCYANIWTNRVELD